MGCGGVGALNKLGALDVHKAAVVCVDGTAPKDAGCLVADERAGMNLDLSGPRHEYSSSPVTSCLIADERAGMNLNFGARAGINRSSRSKGIISSVAFELRVAH